jgi:ADP-ribosylglycohydrolase/fructose-1,6-bisphosphatase/inositol monophosphatase family enzyme
MHDLPRRILPEVIAIVERAGARLADEFARPDGPRGHTDKADIDVELELYLRESLLALCPGRFVGEECGIVAAPDSPWCWLVDPQDGTRAFLQGKRGSAVSVALLHEGIPVLGVVFSPFSPDLGPDLIAWAEGCEGLLRNGETLHVDLSRRTLAANEVVFLSHHSPRRPMTNAGRVAPARFIPMPSIAYRMARVAAGDGVATASVSGPGDLDYAAGHALLRGAGGIMIDETGAEVTYTREGYSKVGHCFAGAPAAVRAIAARDWGATSEARHDFRVHLTWPRIAEGETLDRACGALLGQIIGDSLGSLVEFQSAGEIRATYPDGVRDLADGGVWNTLAGQPTDDSELALTLARTLIATGDFDAEAIAAAYGRWYASRPFDIGTTTRQALAVAARAPRDKGEAARRAADRNSQSNGALMRVSPIGIWAHSPGEAAAAAMADADLSHPHAVSALACGAYAAANAAGVGGADRLGMLRAAETVAADGAGQDDGVISRTLATAKAGALPADFQHRMGLVVIALQNAFFHLIHTESFEDALVRTVGEGGDTDTNAAVAGALLGAAVGRRKLPGRWVRPVLACRPDATLGVGRPRPDIYWPDDVLDVAEALLNCRPLLLRTTTTLADQ